MLILFDQPVCCVDHATTVAQDFGAVRQTYSVQYTKNITLVLVLLFQCSIICLLIYKIIELTY